MQGLVLHGVGSELREEIAMLQGEGVDRGDAAIGEEELARLQELVRSYIASQVRSCSCKAYAALGLTISDRAIDFFVGGGRKVSSERLREDSGGVRHYEAVGARGEHSAGNECGLVPSGRRRQAAG